MNKFNTFSDFKTFIEGYNCHPIPLEFSNSLTTTEFFHILLGYVKELASVQDSVSKNLYQILEQKFNELKTEIDNDTAFFERYKDKIYHYCVTTLQELICDCFKYITFGLEDGYFVAYVPDVWKDIIFNTNSDFAHEDFGKLQVIY